MILAVLVIAFVFWRKTKDEHYQEEEAFDAFLLAGVVGLLIGRVAYVLLQLPRWGLDIAKWFDVISYPGSILIATVVGAAWYLRRQAIKQKWDPFELLDFWVTAVAAGLSVVWLGLFFDGSYIGDPTRMPWGITFPGLFEKHHPVQLYLAAYFWLVFWYLSQVEYKYRTYAWYQGNRNTAQTGFITAMFAILVSLGGLVFSLVAPSYLVVFGVPLDELLAVVGMLFGAGLLFVRSGRSLRLGRSGRRV